MVIGVVLLVLYINTLAAGDPESIKPVSEEFGRHAFLLCATTFLTALPIWLIARNAPRPWPFIGLTGLALPIFVVGW